MIADKLVVIINTYFIERLLTRFNPWVTTLPVFGIQLKHISFCCQTR